MDPLKMITKDEIKERIDEYLRTFYRKSKDSASILQIYNAVAFAVKELVSEKWMTTHKIYNEQEVKTVYYLSMEFLMGRFLGNTIINLGQYEEISTALSELGVDYKAIEETERDPGLGNGGLGRLAACFLDSLSTLGFPAYGCGIRYHAGIFEQRIEKGYQVEYPDNWLSEGDAWGVKRNEYAKEVKFGGNVATYKLDDGRYRFKMENYSSVLAVPYDYPILGYKTNTVNTLRLWDAEAKDPFNLKAFNEGNYQRALEDQNLAYVISEVLYPADEFIAGKELRLKQQYFFISATLQRVLQHYHQHYDDWSLLPDKVQFQLNDTHPTVAVAELMRLLLDEYWIEWDLAWEITQKTCAYTNHTIMSEALEKWPIELFSRLLPRIYMIVEEINKRFCAKLINRYGNAPDKIRRMAIIADGQVRMAYLAIEGSHSVNGVAAIHSEILKTQELKDFYEIYPEKFNNKTNGITQRRWLAHSNPRLAGLITDTIGDAWITDLDQLKQLMPYREDSSFREKFMQIKRQNKVDLANYIYSTKGIEIDPDAIFDIQVKRLHEYKRQLLNVFHILYLHNELRLNPEREFQPQVFIFGAKASASYHRAKLIIKLINAVADVVNNDRCLEGKLKVLFMENYRVSLAEKLIPAADVSEQISTAGKEASGTGNMKFMLNGAVTIGTLDGANVEIKEEVGDENIFIFGMTADEAINLSRMGNYKPWDLYNLNGDIRHVLTTLINGAIAGKEPDIFRELYEAMLNGYGGSRPDEYFILKDFESYQEAQCRVNEAYRDEERWAKMAVANTASSGKFSSDRTILEYARDVWELKQVPINM
ncbi:MAG: glycogen/starch/alpha-glucan phosphorylase [Clostridiales bacterium]|jgi:starch phosphorylase|nr:glycogen/starch/alpha-glucan phosphorylase [Clostridiales bacterium]